jgi:hypothetical protein
MSYRRSPTLSAVLRDLEDTERHRKCQAYTWKYDAGTFTCSECRIVRSAGERLFDSQYNKQDGVASTDPANMRAPWAEATPSVQGVRHSGSRQNG